jgi:hypothetical protein
MAVNERSVVDVNQSKLNEYFAELGRGYLGAGRVRKQGRTGIFRSVREKGER